MPESRQKTPLPPDENPWRAAGLVTAIGVELAVCVGLGWWIGSTVDRNNGTSSWYMVGLVLGLIAGIGSAVGLIRKYASGERRK